MELFWNTIQITFGIILPISMVVGIYLAGLIVVGIIEYLKTLNQLKEARIYETRPFNEVQTSFDKMNKSLHIRLYRKGTKVWEGEISDDEIR